MFASGSQSGRQDQYESQNAARVATAELARAQAQPVGVVHRIATPLPEYAVSPLQSQNPAPCMQANLRTAANPEGGYQGNDRMDDLMREELAAVERCTPPKHRRDADEQSSNAGSVRGSPLIAAQPA